MTPSAAYQYLPAFTRYAHKISVIHFIGPHKPWKRLSYRPAGLGVSQDSASSMSCEFHQHPFTSSAGAVLIHNR